MPNHHYEPELSVRFRSLDQRSAQLCGPRRFGSDESWHSGEGSEQVRRSVAQALSLPLQVWESRTLLEVARTQRAGTSQRLYSGVGAVVVSCRVTWRASSLDNRRKQGRSLGYQSEQASPPRLRETVRRQWIGHRSARTFFSLRSNHLPLKILNPRSTLLLQSHSKAPSCASKGFLMNEQNHRFTLPSEPTRMHNAISRELASFRQSPPASKIGFVSQNGHLGQKWLRSATRKNSPGIPSVPFRKIDPLFLHHLMLCGTARKPHQIVRTLDAVIRPSRLITGTPKYRPVAATIRSGISGTSSRGTFRKASTMPVVSGASSST